MVLFSPCTHTTQLMTSNIYMCMYGYNEAGAITISIKLIQYIHAELEYTSMVLYSDRYK